MITELDEGRATKESWWWESCDPKAGFTPPYQRAIDNRVSLFAQRSTMLRRASALQRANRQSLLPCRHKKSGPAGSLAPAPKKGASVPAVAPSAQASAGLSPDFAAEFAERVGRGQRMPVAWNNPGAFGQVGRLSDDVILAMPPPRRPMHPMSEGYLTWRYMRSFSLALIFVALALYLQVRPSVYPPRATRSTCPACPTRA